MRIRKLGHSFRHAEQDQDYIVDLINLSKSSDPEKAKEALEALEFLKAMNYAEYLGSWGYFEDTTGVKPSTEFKRQAYERQNSALRDLQNQIDSTGFETTEFNDLTDENVGMVDIASAVELAKRAKREFRKEGKTAEDWHQQGRKEKQEPLPVKKYTKEEIAKLNGERNKGKK